jgi:hypothetical protein
MMKRASPGPLPPFTPVTSLLKRLPWDLATSFPRPCDEAIDAGVLDASDLDPDNLRALHDSRHHAPDLAHAGGFGISGQELHELAPEASMALRLQNLYVFQLRRPVGTA